MSFLDIESGGLPPVRRQQDPSQALAAGVFQINTAVASFKRLIDSLGTPKDTPALRDKLHKTRQRIGKLAKETAAKLKTTSNHAQNDSSSPQQKVTGAKLAKDFQAVLVEFQNAQKTAQEREKYYAPFVPQAVLPDR
jgi:syntaxin 7